MKTTRFNIFSRILVFAVVLGVVEDIIAIKLATDATINLETIGVIIAVAFVFAIIGELVVDKTSVICKRSNIK